MLIAVEGIDGSGKSTTAKALAESIDFLYTREPTFTSEQADKLNLESKNDIEREIEFAIDRVTHTNNILRKWDNIICDRYIWTGLAYCSVYNPIAYPFAEALYKHKFFIKPDIYIFVEAPVEICLQRRQVQPLEHLKKILEAYEKTRPIVEADSKIITVSGVMKIKDCIRDIKNKMQNIFAADSIQFSEKFKLSKRETRYRCGCVKETFGFEKTTPPDLCEQHGEPIDGESNMVDEA